MFCSEDKVGDWLHAQHQLAGETFDPHIEGESSQSIKDIIDQKTTKRPKINVETGFKRCPGFFSKAQRRREYDFNERNISTLIIIIFKKHPEKKLADKKNKKITSKILKIETRVENK